MTLGKCDALCFVHLGAQFLYQDGPPGSGYDGQFAYYIASNPADAQFHLGNAAYRFQRILYPLLARLFALGQPEWIPVTMILLNVLGIALGTAAFAGLLDQENAVPWTPVLFFAWIGIAHALLYDLNEILALCISLWALIFFFRHRFSAAGLLFGLAALGKDLAFLVSIPVVVHLMATRNWKTALRIGVLSISPYLAWMLVLRIVMQNWSFQHAQFGIVPFGGLAHAAEAIPFVIFLLIIPGAICAGFALQALSDVYALTTLCSYVLLVFLPTLSYGGDAIFRLSTPLVLSGSLLFARLRHRTLQALFTAVWSATAVIALLLAISP